MTILRKDIKNQEQQKVAVVTGGARGIGKCIADEFRKQNVKVYVIDKTERDKSAGDIFDKVAGDHYAGDISDKVAGDHYVGGDPGMRRGRLSDKRCASADEGYR